MLTGEFCRRLAARLEMGAHDYGDRSFQRPPGELLAELQLEALDLAGWGFILWERIERMRERLAEGDYHHRQYPDGLYQGSDLQAGERRAFDAGFALGSKSRDASK